MKKSPGCCFFCGLARTWQVPGFTWSACESKASVMHTGASCQPQVDEIQRKAGLLNRHEWFKLGAEISCWRFDDWSFLVKICILFPHPAIWFFCWRKVKIKILKVLVLKKHQTSSTTPTKWVVDVWCPSFCNPKKASNESSQETSKIHQWQNESVLANKLWQSTVREKNNLLRPMISLSPL